MLYRLIFLGLLTGGLLRAEAAHETRTETYALDPHGEIRITNTNGAVSIATWDRPEVGIEIEKTASSEAYLKEIGVAIDSTPGALTIETSFPHHAFSWFRGESERGEVRLTLKVPAAVALKDIRLVNGALSIAGVQGSIEAETVNGAVRISGLQGPGDVRTVNGSLHVEIAALAAATDVNLRTVNGSVAVRIAPRVQGAIRATTINGRISCDLPLGSLQTGRGHELEGVLGTGGGSIHARTVNGSIHFAAL